MLSFLQDDTKVHWLIIAILVLSIFLLLKHIDQMKKAKAEYYGSTQGVVAGFNGPLQGTAVPTAFYQQYLDTVSAEGIDPLQNPMVGPSNVAEKTTGGVF